MRILFVAVLVALTVASSAVASYPSNTPAGVAQLKAMVGPVTSALQARESALAANDPGKPQVDCRTIFSHLPIVECDTYTLTVTPDAKPIQFGPQLRYVSRSTEAYWSEVCPTGGCHGQWYCTYRVGVSIGRMLTSDGPMQLLNVCNKGWTKAIPA